MTTTLLAEMVPECGGCATSLVDLPPELLTAICVLVACPAVVWCRRVCRRLRDVIDGSLELQYQIELVRDGMIDGRDHGGCLTLAQASQGLAETPRRAVTTTTPAAAAPYSHLTTSDRLARLRALRKGWATLGWTRCVTVPMPGPCCAYELVGGVFCKTQPSARRGRGGSVLSGWPGYGYDDAEGEGEGEGAGAGGLAEDGGTAVHGSRTMSLAWLPKRHDEGAAAARDDLGIPTRDFAMDPSQDLMVLFRGGEDAGLPMVVVFPGMLELHVRTMSTNETHPEASVPVLRTLVLYPITSVLVQIVDDVVGVMYCVDPARPRITIWNWKTGQLVVDRTSASLPPGTWDFSFVHSRALFVTAADGHGTLELFTFTCEPAEGRVPVPATATATASTESDSLTHVATLHLPQIHPSVRVLSLSTHTGPFLAGCPPSAAFASSSRERIHVLTVQYVHLPTLDGPRTRPRVGMVVHQRALERYLEKGAAWKDGAGAGAAMEVPWSEWGRTHARMLPHMCVFQWLRYVHGQRFVMLHPMSKAGKNTLQVLDFNVRRAFDDDDDKERNEGEDRDPSLTLERIDYPTCIVMPNIFPDAVESGLPYREARRDIRGDYSGMMIDDERLVGLKYPAFLTGDMKEIDVFTM